MKTLGIIGGKGLMGSFFAKVFGKHGFRVIVSDLKTKLTNEELVKKSDIVIFSVPINVTEKVIKEVLPHTRKNQLLMDFTSIKTIPVREMMKSESRVIGLHPMFRPSSSGLKNQTVAMCVGRANKKTINEIKKIFQKEGAKIINMNPQKHDKLMSIIQVLLHFHTIVLGHTMRKLGIPIKSTLSVASPIYKLEMNMIGRIFSQNPMLYGSIEMLNPQSKKVISQLLNETVKLRKTILSKNLANFEKSFKKTAQFLGNFKDHALNETNNLLAGPAWARHPS